MSLSKKILSFVLVFLIGAGGGYWFRSSQEKPDPRVVVLEKQIADMRTQNQKLEDDNRLLTVNADRQELNAKNAVADAVKLKGDIREKTIEIEKLRKQITPLEPGFVRVPISFVQEQDDRFALSQKESKKWESAYNSEAQASDLLRLVIYNKDTQIKNTENMLTTSLSLSKQLQKENTKLKFYLKVGGIAVGVGLVLLLLR